MDRKKTYKKIFRRVLFGAAVLVVCLAVLVLIAPRLINLEAVRRMIITDLSGKIGGEIDFQKIKLSFLPLPHAVVYQGRLSIPETVNGKLASLAVYPKIMPLLTGDVRISKISLLRPDFNIKVGEQDKKDIQRPPADIDFKEKMTPIIGALAAIGDDLEVIVKKGRLIVTSKKIADLAFTDIDIRLELPPDRLNFDVKSGSNFSRQISLKGSIDLKELKSRGQINLTEFKPQLLARELLPPEIIGLGASKLNLTLKIEADGLEVIKSELESPRFDLTLKRGRQEVVLKGKGLRGTFHKDRESIRMLLTPLSLDHPFMKLSGSFLMNPAAPRVELKLEGRDVDVGAVRQAALALAGDISTVKDIFDILKAGNVPAVNFTAAGKSISDLEAFENMTIKGNILQGKVLVPAVDLNVENTSGNVNISRGILRVENIKARYGETRVHDGKLRLGLIGENAPFQLDIGLSADLSQVPGVLKQVIGDSAVAAEIDRFSKVSGRAEGRLVLGERLDAIQATVRVKAFNLSAGAGPLPYPLEIKGGGFSYAGKSMEFQALTAKIKNSNFSLSSARLDWEKPPAIAVRSQNASINLKELYSWLSAVESLRQPLKSLQALDGTVNLVTLKLNGPLLQPIKWNFDVTGRLADINLKADFLPEPLTIKKGKFMLTPQVFAVTDVEAESLDASLKLAGRLNGYLEGVKSLDIHFKGTVGAQANRWLLKKSKAPSYLLIQPSLMVSNGHFTWDRRGKTTIAGDFNIHNDLNISADVLLEPQKIFVKKLVIQDKDSQALFALSLHEKDVNFNFKGNLQKSTVDKLLGENQQSSGWIKGDLRLNYFQERPRDSVFEGSLRGKDLVFLKRFKIPLTVNSFSIEGFKDKFHLQADLRLEPDQPLKLNGDVHYSPKEILFDMALITDGIELETLAARLDRDKKGKKKREKEKFYDFPLAGNLKLNSNYLKYKRYDLRPFQADISLHPEKITITVGDTNLCGISTPGTLTLSPREIELHFMPTAQNQDIQSAATCLTDKAAKMEGRFDFSGKVSGRGPSEDLLKALRGDFELQASPGRILAGRSYRTLREILALINVTEIYRGRLPDLTREGFAYNSIRAKVTVKKDTLTIEEGVVDGLTMNIAGKGTLNLADKKINLTVLVAPLKTVDSIVSKIPLVGYILGGSLVTVPVRISGNFDQPKVSLLSPAAVGEGLVGIMKRTLELPIKIMEPVTKGEKPQSGKP